jgi:hypothetical protein
MKYVLLLITFLLALNTNAQIQTTLDYHYYFNSDVDIIDKKFNYLAQEFQSVETATSETNSSLVGISLFIPFNVFNKESLLYSNRFSLDVEGYFQFDHNIGSKLIQQFYRFALNYKLTVNHPIYLYTTLTTASVTEAFESPAVVGHDYKIGINYNITDQLDNQLVNFYGGVNYIVYGEYNTLKPYGNHFNSTTDFETIIGFVVNIKNFFYFEQQTVTLSEFNFPETFSFSPYNLRYMTRASIKIKNVEFFYRHYCFHRVLSPSDNPRIIGQHNSFAVTLDF